MTSTGRRLLAWLLPASALAVTVGALPLLLVGSAHGSGCSHSCPPVSPPDVPVRAMVAAQPHGTWLVRAQVTVPLGVLVGPLSFAVTDGRSRRLFVHPASGCLRSGTVTETFAVPRLPGVSGQRHLVVDYGEGTRLRDCSQIDNSTERNLARL